MLSSDWKRTQDTDSTASDDRRDGSRFSISHDAAARGDGAEDVGETAGGLSKRQ